MSDLDVHSEEPDEPGTATALAEPPRVPPVPPSRNATGEAPRPRPKRTGTVVAVVVAIIALLFIAVVVYLISTQTTHSGDAASRAAFESAMKKAGVQATFPAQPVDVTTLKATGSHPFSATFTAEELAALVNAYPYTSDVAGLSINLRNASMEFPAPGVIKMTANVTANGGTYSGTVTAPASFSAGQISTAGVTDLSVEGISGNDAQKTQVGDALVTYANAYLAAAPGLAIQSARITAAGLEVKGTAPDSISAP